MCKTKLQAREEGSQRRLGNEYEWVRVGEVGDEGVVGRGEG